MDSVLQQLNKYPNANKEFLSYLQQVNMKNISAFLTFKDELAYGFLQMFMLHNGCSLIIGEHTISVVVNNTHVGKFAYVEHNGLSIIYFRKLNVSDVKIKINNGILGFFSQLEDSII